MDTFFIALVYFVCLFVFEFVSFPSQSIVLFVCVYVCVCVVLYVNVCLCLCVS